MVKRYTFALLATALIIAPTAANAGEGSRQELNQSATAIGHGSRVSQRVNQTSIQQRTGLGNTFGCKYRMRYQSQQSNQLANQNGVAIDGGVVEQNAEQLNIQSQIEAKHRFCY
jgi:hypothetical protein